jgi:hypothetical protein
LLVIAATGLAVVLAFGITFVILRVRGRDAGKDERTAATAPSIAEPAQPPRPPVNAPAVAPAREHREPATATAPPPAETAPAELPVWERKPLRTSQPFPEEARFDPPMAPIKIPPEMLIPLGTPDAAGAP